MWREGETDVPDSVTPTVGLFLFFSLAPSSVLLLLLLPLSRALSFVPSPFSLPSLSLPSFESFVITVQSPGFYRHSDVATGSKDFRLDVGTIKKLIRTGRSYILDVDAVMRYSFPKIFIFLSVVLSSND